MKIYSTVEEIKAAFVEDGWSKNINFEIASVEDVHGSISIKNKIKAGKKFFIMTETGNIFDDTGKIALLNLL